MRTIAVIPARFRSKRLPGKPLVDLNGKPMVQRVYERAAGARSVDEVLVATDDGRIRAAVEAFGGRVVMTSARHRSGSDRIAEAVEAIDADWVVNVQGDEPLIAPEAIDAAVAAARSRPGAVASLRRSIGARDRLLDPNVVKVVADRRAFALYFSRSPIPPPPEREGSSLPDNVYYEHVGLYVYPRAVLMRLTGLAASPLERAEKLEQLRALENGIPICVERTDYHSVAVDTPSDLEHARELIARSEAGASGSVAFSETETNEGLILKERFSS